MNQPPRPDAPLDQWCRDEGSTRDRWTVRLFPAGLEVHDSHGVVRLDGADAGRRLRVRTRLLRGPVVTLDSDAGSPPRRLRGLGRREGRRLVRALDALTQRQGAAAALAALGHWYARVETTLADARRDLRWISTETATALAAARPELGEIQQHLMVPPLWGTLSASERAAVHTSPASVLDHIARANAEIADRALVEHADFFATVEKSPLTTEQARAVVTFDNRVHVIAAAGSGKTSVMVARAAYAVQRGFVTPEKILLLAFNKAAAAELAARVTARFTAAGLDASGVRATTFHAFGLDVIGQATGRRPTVAPWVADDQDVAMVARLVTELREHDPGFAHAWDLFRLLYARVSDDWAEEPAADGWDKQTRTAGLHTYAGGVVRSQGERLIADWLYLNHVRYEYERPYSHDTATSSRRQYTPDFYYPDAHDGQGAWHEHWGVDEHGQPPPHMPGYLDSMRWKQRLHRDHGTDLIETTWAGIMARRDFHKLAAELDARGVPRRWDPHRPTLGAAPVKDADLIRLIRTFMTHVKSNSLTRADVEARLRAGRVRNTARAELFLSLYWPIHEQWQAALHAGGYVDFEDMLVQAAAHLEDGRHGRGYDLVMVDEFQDASQARARLTRALVASPGRHLLAVGDDWQSINRFAGADLSVLTRFHDYFGPGPSLYLTTTFRCHQTIAETASAFVTRNPAQLAKTVTAARPGVPDVAAYEGVHLRQVDSTREVPAAIAAFLDELDAAVARGTVPCPAGARVSVDVLGRYRHDRDLVPAGSWPRLRVGFRTVHGAKGLEADYVVVANLAAGVYGFPSQISDDPVLNLAMAEPDGYEHAEERRLFYVALTRARRGVVLVAPAQAPSVFVTELLTRGLLTTGADPDGVDYPVVCPACGRGVLARREGPYGSFWGCSTFPRCQHTTNDPPAAAVAQLEG